MGAAESPRFLAVVLSASAGIVVWALHFAAIYGITGLACARGAPDVAAAGVLAATLVALALLAAIVVRGWRRRDDFHAWLGAAVGGFAALAVVWEALPLLWIEACR